MCVYDGTAGAERHEVFGGALRGVSIREGFQIDVSAARHAELHSGSEWAMRERLFWRRHFQEKYENRLRENGMSEADARRVWTEMMGKNFLDEISESEA